MNKDALAKLVCPETLEPLELIVEKLSGDQVTEGRLEGPGSSYAVREGIPSFVADSDLADQTLRSFAEKWSQHRYYREHTSPFYTDWYLERYGIGDLGSLGSLLEGVEFALDAGTGAGRDAVNLAENSSATVYGVDTAWEALALSNQKTDLPRLGFVHADVTRLPFPDDFFGFINCDQVIHHTPAPRATFEHLRRKLAPGGRVCCYVYRKKAVVREFTDDYVRERLSGLPTEEALAACEGITRLGRALAELDVTLELEEDIPVLGIEKGRFDLQRFFHWNVMKCFWNEDFDFFTNNIINYDWYHPVNCFRFEPEEFRAWFDTGWKVETWDVREAGISCRAVKV